jgi:hypothetical protein
LQGRPPWPPRADGAARQVCPQPSQGVMPIHSEAVGEQLLLDILVRPPGKVADRQSDIHRTSSRLSRPDSLEDQLSRAGPAIVESARPCVVMSVIAEAQHHPTGSPLEEEGRFPSAGQMHPVASRDQGRAAAARSPWARIPDVWSG